MTTHLDSEPAPIGKQSLTAKSLRGVGWLGSSSVLLAFLRIGVVAAMARLLTPEDFGIMAAASIFTELASLLSESGIIHPLVQRKSISERHIETAFTANLLSGLVATAVICLIAGRAADFFGMPQLRDVLYVMSALYPLTGISAISSKLLEREHSFRPIAQCEVVSFLLGHALVGIGMAATGFGVWALVGATFAAGVIRSFVLFRAQPHTLRLRIRWQTYMELMSQGLGYTAQRFSNIVSLKGDFLVVGRALDAGSLGLYDRAYVLMNLSNRLVMSSLNKVLFPAFSRIQDDPERLRAAFLRCTALVALIFLPVSAFTVLLAPEVVAVLLGPQWRGAVVPFTILSLAMFFRTGRRIAGVTMNGIGKPYWSAISQTIFAICVVGGALIGVRWGITGVAIFTALSIFVVYCLQTALVMYFIGLRLAPFLLSIFPAAALAVVAAGTAYGVKFAVGLADQAPLVTLICAGAAAAAITILPVLAFPALLGRHTLTTVAPLVAAIKPRLDKLGIPTFWLRRLARSGS